MGKRGYMHRGPFFTRAIREHGYKTGVEVGEYLGDFSGTLLLGSDMGKLYSIDRWLDLDGKPMEKELAETRGKLDKYGARSEVVVSDSIKASGMFGDGSLDFIYIDADHSYEAVLADVKAWWPKLRPGGMISGHDYHDQKGDPDRSTCKAWHCRFGVKSAVDEFAAANGLTVGQTAGISKSWWLIKGGS